LSCGIDQALPAARRLAERLRGAYDAVPAHQRRYLLGDMDRKDGAIREVLGYDDEVDDSDSG
jgi:hypothetical protein